MCNWCIGPKQLSAYLPAKMSTTGETFKRKSQREGSIRSIYHPSLCETSVYASQNSGEMKIVKMQSLRRLDARSYIFLNAIPTAQIGHKRQIAKFSEILHIFSNRNTAAWHSSSMWLSFIPLLAKLSPARSLEAKTSNCLEISPRGKPWWVENLGSQTLFDKFCFLISRLRAGGCVFVLFLIRPRCI